MISSYISERFPDVQFDIVSEGLLSFETTEGFLKGIRILGMTVPYQDHGIQIPYKPHIAYTCLARFIPEDNDILIRAQNFVVKFGEHTVGCKSSYDAEETLESFKSIDSHA